VQDFESPYFFDSIISNPPYYPETHFIAAPNEQRRMARSTQTLPYTELLQAVARLLHPEKGIFSLILPIETEGLFISLASAQGLFLSKRMRVIPRSDKAANRVLLCFSKHFSELDESELMLRTGHGAHDYSTAARELLKDFLIIF
jgi:tRNA1Val (adenine37-N6)-methyltransferase